MAYEDYGDSYAIFEAGRSGSSIGVPLAWLASRVPVKWVRALAYPALLGVALLGLLRPATSASTSTATGTGSRSGPVQIQPSEIAKLAMIIWAADIYAKQGPPARRLAPPDDPGVPGMVLGSALVVVGRTTSAPRWCSSRSCSACSGWSARRCGCSSACCSPRSACVALAWPAPTPSGIDRITTLRRSVQRPATAPAGRPRTASSRWRPAAVLRRGHRRQPAEVGHPARGPHRLHLRGHRRGARPGRHAGRPRAVPRPRPTPAFRIALRTKDPFVRYRSRHRDLAAGQALINVGMVLGAAAGHRASRCRWSRTAARPAADPDRARAAARLRPARAGGARAARPAPPHASRRRPRLRDRRLAARR